MLSDMPDKRIFTRLDHLQQLLDDAKEAATKLHDEVYSDAVQQMSRVVQELLNEVPVPSAGIKEIAR